MLVKNGTGKMEPGPGKWTYEPNKDRTGFLSPRKNGSSAENGAKVQNPIPQGPGKWIQVRNVLGKIEPGPKRL